MKFYIILFSLSFYVHLYGQFKINIDSPDSNLVVECYFPFDSFANSDVPTPIKRSPVTGKWATVIRHREPIMVKLTLNGRRIMVSTTEKDSLQINVYPYNASTKLPIVDFRGTNAKGFEYYNMVYLENGINRIKAASKIFEDWTIPIDKILESMANQTVENSKWIDIFSQNQEVTTDFAQLFKSDIIASYAFYIQEARKKYYEHLSDEEKATNDEKIRNFLLLEKERVGNKIDNCTSAAMYYNDYYKMGLPRQEIDIDTTYLLIPSEFGHLAQAPVSIRSYVIGSYLVAFRKYVPTMFPYCELYKKYIELYDHPAIEAYMQATNPCVTKDTTGIILENAYETTFGDLIQNHFRGKRLYIDLWATWCIPCKMEFAHYTEDFYRFLKKYDIENVFLSIDNDSRHQMWLQEVKKLQLNGYHIRLNESLQKAIKDEIFKGENISIPRYLLVDEYGKIVSIDASRPANVSAEIRDIFKQP